MSNRAAEDDVDLVVSLKELQALRELVEDIRGDLLRVVRGFEALSQDLSAIVLGQELKELKRLTEDDEEPAA